MSYHASPAFRCHAPGRSFGPGEEESALSFARHSADRYNVPFIVWRIQGGRARQVRRFNPPAKQDLVRN